MYVHLVDSWSNLKLVYKYKFLNYTCVIDYLRIFVNPLCRLIIYYRKK